MTLRPIALRILFHPQLDSRGRDEVSRAMGMLMRNTGFDEDDALRLLRAAADRLPEPDRTQILEDINV